MTNKEHLATLSAEDWYMRIDWLYHKYGKRYTDSRAAIIAWLDDEYKKLRPWYSNDITHKTPFCPMCYTPLIEGENCARCMTQIEW